MRTTKISPSSIRGHIYEELVNKLLTDAGFSTPPRTYQNPRIKMKGRSVNHQIDCIKSFPFTSPFSYPLRLLVEVKGWKGKVGTPSLMKFNSAVKDISEFGNREYKSDENVRTIRFGDHLIERFIDVPAFVSLKGFSRSAEEYGMLNGMFLVSHSKTPQILKILDDLKELIDSIQNFTVDLSKRDLAKKILDPNSKLPNELNSNETFMQKRDKVIRELNLLFALFGSIDGRVPVHLISENFVDLTKSGDIIGRLDRLNGAITLRLYEGDKELFLASFTLPDFYLKYLTLHFSGKINSTRNVRFEPLRYISIYQKVSNKLQLFQVPIVSHPF